MSFTPAQLLTRTGRIVWGGGDDGGLYTPKTKDYEGNPLVIKSGADAGKPTQRFELGLAIQKAPGEAHFGSSPEGAIIWAQGHKDHPGSASRPDFAWKVTDGDSVIPGKAKNGKPGRRPCDKEGFAGHWIYTFSSSYPFKFLNANGSAYLLDANAVKVGDYVQVAGNVVGNTGATPGVYLNHSFVALQDKGTPITNGPDPTTLGFGGGPKPTNMQLAAAGAGAMTAPPVVAAPLPAATPPPPVALPTAAPPAPLAAAPLPPAVPLPTAVAPNPAILGAAPPPPAATVAAPPPPAAPQMTAAAQFTYDGYKAGGWTDDQMRAHGVMV